MKEREIVRIDPDKCNGCGLCVPKCAEGAIRIIDGKAYLAADNLCDGLGACLGTCPKDAITIERRSAEAFDAEAVHHAAAKAAPVKMPHARPGDKPLPCGCPGSAMRQLKPAAGTAKTPADAPADIGQSRLENFPVQLALLPEQGEIWQDADVLVAADCVAFALPAFHEQLLAGKKLAIACPKLDDAGEHADKLTRIFAANSVASVTVAHMEVPCCSGIVRAVEQAVAASGKKIPVIDVTIAIDGHILRIQNR
ncbi:MAG: 4Fe-4S binding protein [Planctomycetes bacterium]|nr:4Fe-4S binding protein [Planctomycetota bacterium]